MRCQATTSSRFLETRFLRVQALDSTKGGATRAVMTKLKPTSLAWGLKHVLKDGDTDIFPKPFGLAVVKRYSAKFLSKLASIEIESHTWEGPRRLMVPKADLAFRPICQLDPLDSILYAAIIREIGAKIERHRSKNSEQCVFSYRFAPLENGQLYRIQSGWEDFWKTSQALCAQYSHVLITDLADFYNQIYHHTIENQLDECGIDKPYRTSLKRLIANTTEGVSRGIPIGPHPSHLLAEMSLIPIDSFLKGLNVRFCRYVDDIHIFCKSRNHAHEVLYSLVEYLDKTQKLQTNKQKTRILNAAQFAKVCADNAIDKPINTLEQELLVAVRSYTQSPYERVPIKKVSVNDLTKLSRQNIESVLKEYIDAPDVDYVRLRWFIRRLTQVGVPGGIPFIVSRFEEFLPAISDVAQYFEAAAGNYKGDWKDIGGKILDMYESSIIQANEFLRVVVLSLFARVDGINHIDRVTSYFANATPMCRRKILLAAAESGAGAWLSSHKSLYKTSDDWTRRAAIYSMRALPADEKSFWLKSVQSRVDGLDRSIADDIA
jgi:hypothetical protein